MFIGRAGIPVTRIARLQDQPPFELMVTPVEVEHAYLGVTTRVMYLTAIGIEAYATPGRRYLVYGRSYQPPDIVTASPGVGMKMIETAADDLGFLESLTASSTGSTIIGRVARNGPVEFSIPAILSKGELEYVVETSHRGTLTFCFVQLEDVISRRSSHDVKSGVTYRRPVVDGQRYQVHVHVERMPSNSPS